MTATKHNNWVKKGLSLLLAVAMVLSMGVVNAFAVETGELPDGAVRAVHLDAPVEDGVYRGTVNLMNANSSGQYSMGNTALRGSESYESKNPDDAGFQPLIVVKDGKATAILEFMPLGYLGTYGFMMELEGVDPQYFSKYGAPLEDYTTYTPATLLAQHKTQDGDVVYDVYNNPDSESVFDGSDPSKHTRPAGYGKDEQLIDIAGDPYPWVLALDVTPVIREGAEVPTAPEDFDVNAAAFCHVFVPVMFSISPSSGDQYARLMVDWTTLTKVENPEDNLQYQLYLANQIQQGDYSQQSYENLQACIQEVKTALSNRWPSQELTLSGSGFQMTPVLNYEQLSQQEEQELVQKLKTAVNSLTEPVDTSALEEALAKAEDVQKTQYTQLSVEKLEQAVEAGEAMLEGSASQEELDAQAQAILDAIDALEPIASSEGWDGVTVKEPLQFGTSVYITSAEELAWVAQQINAGSLQIDTIFLQNDIDLNGKEWTPIGTQESPYQGLFYGNGYTVSNLVITSPGNYKGLFGYVAGAEGQTVSFGDVYINGSMEVSGRYIGALAGYMEYANVSQVTSWVNITVNSNQMTAYAGGIAGAIKSCDLNLCVNNGDITAKGLGRVGGIAGDLSGGNIHRSENHGDITGGGSVGGILGNYYSSNLGSVLYAVNTGDVTGSSSGVGGIVGYVSAKKDTVSLFNGLYNRGKVTGSTAVGGLIGSFSGNLSTTSAAYSTGEVVATGALGKAGSAIGTLYSGLMYNLYALENSAEELYHLGLNADYIEGDVEFHSEDWFKSQEFFMALGAHAGDFAEDTKQINDGYPVLQFQMEKILDSAKQTALKELDGYKNADHYKGLSKDAVEQVKSEAAGQIEAAATEEEVAQLLQEAKKKLDAIPNDANYGLDTEALQEKLAQAQHLVAQGNDLYTTESWNSLTAAVSAVEYLLENGFETQEKVDTYRKNLENNMNGLVYKPADYTAVDKAMAKIPADLSLYTQETADALQKAVAAVERGLDITKQSRVDAMARAIEQAVAALELKEEEPPQEPEQPLDKNNLPDGIYSVYVDMVKTNRVDLSMSNNAINHTVKLEVVDGVYYVTLDFKGITIDNRFGYLSQLSYYAEGYSYTQYGGIEGQRIPAQVLSTQKDADGNDVVDQYNDSQNLYPDLLKIQLVPSAIADPDGFVPLHVFVPIMEAIATGNGDQDVLMKIDWSTLTKTTEEDPGFQPEQPVEQSPAVDLTDGATGIKVHADKGVFEEGVQLVVKQMTSGSDYKDAASALSDVGKKFKLYDIRFVDASGNEVSPNGTVEISFPIASGYDSSKVAVYRMNGSSKTLVKGAVEDGYYTVVTKTAGQYALVEKGSAVVDNPHTGESTNAVLWVLLAVSVGTMGAILTLKKRKVQQGEES